MTAGLRLAVAAVLTVLAGYACSSIGPRAERQAPDPTSQTGAALVRSNLLREDYAGSAACAGCHSSIHAAWAGSPMHRMTRAPQPDDIRAPLGKPFHFKQDRALLERHGDRSYVRVQSRAFGDHLYRITRVIGGRYREDFAGREVTGPEPDAATIGPPEHELVLPLSFVFADASFRLKGYSVMVKERPGLRAGGVWNQTCIACHNTLPQFSTYWSALHGPGAPGHQSVLVDRLLPPERRLNVVVTDEDLLAQALRAEISALGGDAGDRTAIRSLLADAARTSHARLGASHLVELGIGCESCHGGSREHVQHLERAPAFEPRSRFLALQPPAGRPPVTGPEWINRACARCHQVLFSRYSYTWEAGLRAGSPGGSHINSGEARDFLLGGCARQMACTTCHDPHGGSRPADLSALATPAGNRVCTGCHAHLASAAAVQAHSHHDPGGAGGSCVGCHMPRKNMGLDYQLTRYHRVGSPTDRARVEGDRPLECALCHPRDTVATLVGAMERWWGKRYDRAALTRLYGNLRAPVLEATLKRGLPHEQVVAIGVLGEQRVRSAEPLLATQLVHEYPLVRYYARRALERLRGAAIDLDVERDTSEIRAAVARLWPAAPLPTSGVVGGAPSDEGQD